MQRICGNDRFATLMEIEKSLSKASTNGVSDSGTSSRSFATFLTWLSDHTTPVFVVATSNDHTKLPTELVRKGRFDELFWCELPTQPERIQIFDVLLKRYKRDSSKYNLKGLADRTEGYTGAEIEQVITGAMFNRFDRDGKDFTTTDLVDEINATKPMSVTAEEELKQMRSKAVGRLRVASGSGSARMFTMNEGGRTEPADRRLEIS